MRLSDLINQLQEIYHSHGDKMVYCIDAGGFYDGLEIRDGDINVGCIYLEFYVRAN